MARIGGRSLWLAIPAGILSIAIVAALVWLAIPMVPVVVTWVGDTLRSSAVAAEEQAAAPAPATVLAEDSTLDCRDLYPDDVWAELIWHGDILLSQTTARAPIAAPELYDALGPTVALTCSWTLDETGLLVSSVADVAPDAGPIVEAALGAQGFSCQTDDVGLTCSRSSGGSSETHVLRNGLWLSTVSTGWSPVDYAPRLAAYVWS